MGQNAQSDQPRVRLLLKLRRPSRLHVHLPPRLPNAWAAIPRNEANAAAAPILALGAMAHLQGNVPAARPYSAMAIRPRNAVATRLYSATAMHQRNGKTRTMAPLPINSRILPGNPGKMDSAVVGHPPPAAHASAVVGRQPPPARVPAAGHHPTLAVHASVVAGDLRRIAPAADVPRPGDRAVVARQHSDRWSVAAPW